MNSRNKVLVLLVCVMGIGTHQLTAQKTISEGTIVYDIIVDGKTGDAKNASVLNGAKSILYLKGSLSRTDMVSPLGNESTIYNGKTGTAVILREYSGQKLMITLTKNNWAEKNKKFDGLNFEKINGSKQVQGYDCKKAIAKLPDGSTLTVFYAPELNLVNKEYSQAFKTLPGFPMEYEFETGNTRFKYTVSQIDFNPLSATKFDFPKSGYRVMTYEDNQQKKKDG
jgi:GLPGLI family protein